MVNRILEIEIEIARLNKSRLPYWVIENRISDLKLELKKLIKNG
jgi:hypothetical protein